MALPFGTQASGGSTGNNSYLPPEQGIDGQQGGAPGGRWPQDDLPMRPTSTPGNGWSEGFSPSPENPPMPSSHTDGVGLTPNGIRR